MAKQRDTAAEGSPIGTFRYDPLKPARKLLCVVLALAAICLQGCATGRVNLWPFLFHETRVVDGAGPVTTTEAVYPLFHREARPDMTWHTVRPFYNYERRPATAYSRVQYLWPLGLHVKDGDKLTRHRFFPFFDYNKVWSGRFERHSVHAHILQLLRWGSDAEHGPYLALFPLAGVTHGVIAPTWSFVAFPLYSFYQRSDGYSRHDFPWPFFGFGRTPDGMKRMCRFWPFYVYQRDEGDYGLYVRRDLMWPLFRWGKTDRGGRYHHTVFSAVPFFSWVRTWDREDHLAAYQLSVLGVTVRRDSRQGPVPRGWAALWGLLRTSQDGRDEQTRFFPFYWNRTSYKTSEKDPDQSYSRTAAPWPLVWFFSDKRKPGARHNGFVLAPLYWHFTDTYRDDDGAERKARRITLWPLATWQQDADGGRHFWIASHGWKDSTTGFKRNLRALFDFFQYHRRADGTRETRILSRLYHHRSAPNGRYLSIASFFTYDSTAEVVGEEGKYFSLFFGVVKRSWTDQESKWRIFYIPL